MRSLVLAVALLVAAFLPGCASSDPSRAPAVDATGFSLTSASFANGTAIPVKHSCDGGEASPALVVSGAPAGTASIALALRDLDVRQPPDNRSLAHWLVWNVTTGGAVFPEGGLPLGASEGRNDVGRDGYLGMCPPKGGPAHHYRFTAYALDARLPLAGNATAAQFEAALAGHVLAQTSLSGTYARQS